MSPKKAAGGAIVLLSGGQDSTTCLYWALTEFARVHALSFHYGQRHATEVQQAARIASNVGVTHHVIDVADAFRVASGSALTDASQRLQGSGGLADSECPDGLPTSFVPGRNLIFLSLAASLAVKLEMRTVVAGFCQTDHNGYPDCRRPFIDAMEEATRLAMPSGVGSLSIETPLMFLTKAETVELAQALPGCLPALAHTVTCYHGKHPGCGECPACEQRALGFAEAGIPDPGCA